MSEELIQKNLVEAPEKMGDWNFYNIGATTLKALKAAKIIPNRDYEEFEAKKPDALIVKKPLVIAAIEYKVPAQLRTGKQIERAIKQEIGTAQALQASVKIVLPIDEFGNPDLQVQNGIAKKYLALEQYKNDIAEKLRILIQQKIEL